MSTPGKAVARLMHWNGKGGRLGVVTPIARTYTEMPQGEAPYWDEGEPLYMPAQAISAAIPPPPGPSIEAQP
jgi:hypothetical protein